MYASIALEKGFNDEMFTYWANLAKHSFACRMSEGGSPEVFGSITMGSSRKRDPRAVKEEMSHMLPAKRSEDLIYTIKQVLLCSKRHNTGLYFHKTLQSKSKTTRGGSSALEFFGNFWGAVRPKSVGWASPTMDAFMGVRLASPTPLERKPQVHRKINTFFVLQLDPSY